MLVQRLAHAIRTQNLLKDRFRSQVCRSIRTSSEKRALVGPPDPVSNLRPVIYDDVEPGSISSGRRRKGKGKQGESEAESEKSENPGSSSSSTVVKQPQTSTSHPYLLDEFSGDPLDYQWRLERGRLDAYNHAFWKDVRVFFDFSMFTRLNVDAEQYALRNCKTSCPLFTPRRCNTRSPRSRSVRVLWKMASAGTRSSEGVLERVESTELWRYNARCSGCNQSIPIPPFRRLKVTTSTSAIIVYSLYKSQPLKRVPYVLWNIYQRDLNNSERVDCDCYGMTRVWQEARKIINRYRTILCVYAPISTSSISNPPSSSCTASSLMR